MIKRFRIHGDNIVECERLYALISKSIQILQEQPFFLSPACPSMQVTTATNDSLIFEFFPGFNKNTSDRWSSNIFQILKDRGSFLNETPDVLLTELTPAGERILIAIEFCSALQAGNQAWQRSGRAYSTARSNVCPYLYIVDFVKYELDDNRNRIALRFPNAAIPFSYYLASSSWKYPVIQVYFRSEEFQPAFDPSLQNFDPSWFGQQDVCALLSGLLYDKDVRPLYTCLIQKSLSVLNFMAAANRSHSYTLQDWQSIRQDYSGDILAFSKDHNRFPFMKKIAKKSVTGRNRDFADLATKYSIGIASRDLPFGLIPSYAKIPFARELQALYPEMGEDFYTQLSTEQDMIVCMFKGFKPQGDDARPDRGILPFIAMLMGEAAEILTFVYGETTESALQKLDQDILSLANGNGLWSAIVSLSDFIILDAPKIPKEEEAPNVIRLIPNKANKAAALTPKTQTAQVMISPFPNHYTENDVDTFIHMIFKHLIPNTFEGFCNPPGGDWSGISLPDSLDPSQGREFRWLTLPRVSHSKRPDHITVLFDLLEKPLILCTESKESFRSLEPGIGPALTKYIYDLLAYPPSVERPLYADSWTFSSSCLSASDYLCASMGCFFATASSDLSVMADRVCCDVLMGFWIDIRPLRCSLQIQGFSPLGRLLAKHFTHMIQSRNSPVNIFHII